METIDVFVGYGDTDELTKMGNKAIADGAIAGSYWKEILPELDGKILKAQDKSTCRVNISGGLVEICVPDLARYLLELGVPVYVNLLDCRSDHTDKNTDRIEHVEFRRKRFLEELSSRDRGQIKNRHLLTIAPPPYPRP